LGIGEEVEMSEGLRSAARRVYFRTIIRQEQNQLSVKRILGRRVNKASPIRLARLLAKIDRMTIPNGRYESEMQAKFKLTWNCIY